MPARQFHFGLEAGSKPELVAALAMHKDPESLIICNGYKDPAFIRIALLGRKLGKSVIIVVEKLEELEQTIRASKEVGVEPHHRHSGAPAQQRLGQMGAQRRREREVRPRYRQPRRRERNVEGRGTGALPQAGSFPCRLAGARHLDDQTRGARSGALLRQDCRNSVTSWDISMSAAVSASITMARAATFDSSTNYSLQEYANDVVWNIMDVCDSENVPHPAIVNEGGRAIVAHHSVLVVEAFSSIEKTAPKLQGSSATEKDHKLVGDILDVKQRLKRGNRMESLHDIQQIKEESQQTFDLGLLDLESKAKIDTRLLAIGHSRSSTCIAACVMCPEEVKELETSLGDQYICNFSVFQSLLDHWALGQLFPDHADSSADRSRPSATARLSTSPATPTARSPSSSTCRMCATRCRCIELIPAKSIISASSWLAPIRTSWATCTICLAASPKCTSFSIRTKKPAGTSRKSSKAAPSAKCSP